MILREDDKSSGREVFRRGSVPSLPKGRILTGVNKPFPKRLGHLANVAKIPIISFPFLCKEGMEAVVEIVVPLGIQAISSPFRSIDDPSIVKVAFGDDMDGTTESLSLRMNGFPYIKQNVSGTEVKNSMNGIHPKAVHVILCYPVEGIVNDKPSNLIAFSTVKVDGRSPWGSVTVGKVGSKIVQIIPFGSEMVVNNIKEKG
jgi:hypothetical protein